MLRNSLKRTLDNNLNYSKKDAKSKYKIVHKNILTLSHKSGDDAQEVKELEQLVFGGEDEVIERLEHASRSKAVPKNTRSHIIKRTRRAVWEDEDDILLESNNKPNGGPKEELYAKKLRNKLLNHVGNPKWAQLDNKDIRNDDSDEEILQTSTNLLKKSQVLPSGSLDINSCRDINHDGWSKGMLKTTEFHPNAQVALVANSNGTITLFQVDGKSNPKIQGVHFERFSIQSAHFTADGEQIVAGSPDQSHLYYYDMMVGKIVKVPWSRGIEHCSTQHLSVSPDGKLLVICGRFGEMHLITAKSKEWVGSLKMNGEVRCIAFNKDGHKMFSHGENGQVYIWDMNSRRCLHTFVDEGCVQGTALALSPNEQYLAAGSDCGVVNIYKASSLYGNSNPKPLKVILNLTTEVSALKFNHSSEILAMASSYKDNSVKLLHVPTISVFSNFPNFNQTNLRKIKCLDFSLNSGYFAMGNNAGRACLYRLKHFSNF